MSGVSTISESDIWAVLDAEDGGDLPSIQPPGSITAMQYADARGISHSGAANKLRKLVREGKLAVVWFRPPGLRPQASYLTAGKAAGKS